LRSPFNGELWTVPPPYDQDKTFVDAMLARGFVREDAETAEPKKKGR